MTNFRKKYTSCVSKIARETDLEISRNCKKKKKKKNTDIFAQVLFCLHKIAFQPDEKTHKNGQQNLLLKNFIQISVSLCLKAKRLPLAHRRAVWLST